MTLPGQRKRSFFIRDILSDVYSGGSSKHAAEKVRYRGSGIEPFLLSTFAGKYISVLLLLTVHSITRANNSISVQFNGYLYIIYFYTNIESQFTIDIYDM